MRTYRTLSAAGVDTIDDAGRRDWDDLVKLLGEGGYARYDYRTATRLLDLSAAVAEQHPNGIEAFGASQDDSQVLTQALDDLPGWGPVTVAAFLHANSGGCGLLPTRRSSTERRPRHTISDWWAIRAHSMPPNSQNSQLEPTSTSAISKPPSFASLWPTGAAPIDADFSKPQGAAT